MRRTKIIVSLGPSSQEEEILGEFLKLGVDVLRMNFSHGTISEHLSQIKQIRSLSKKIGFEPAILLDLPGPKIRVGEIASGFLELNPGDEISLSAKKEAKHAIPVKITNLDKFVKPGERILLVDGKIELRAKEILAQEVRAEVVRGGILHSRQGINFPDSDLPFPSLTQRDREGIELAFKEDVDWLALSFVRMEEDLIELRDIVATRGEHMGVIAKIERPEAVRNIKRIVQASDGVMVARGDLGVEMGVEEVPVLQKKIVSLCKQEGKPSIIATQMLESMLEKPYPTRAEVSDIANAIYDGVDCVMLSDETAVGKYPLEAVRVMLDVIAKTEESLSLGMDLSRKEFSGESYSALGHAGCTLALEINARAIVCTTFSGLTAQMLSRYRPAVPIYAFTPSRFVRNKMNLLWGVYPYLIDYTTSIDELIASTVEFLRKREKLCSGDLVVFIAGIPLQEGSETNFIKLHRV